MKTFNEFLNESRSDFVGLRAIENGNDVGKITKFNAKTETWTVVDADKDEFTFKKGNIKKSDAKSVTIST
jgi:hypothetical protein